MAMKQEILIGIQLDKCFNLLQKIFQEKFLKLEQLN